MEDKLYMGKRMSGKNVGDVIGMPGSVIPTLPNPFVFAGTTSVVPVYFGGKRYELSDWLGNVRVVVNDRKTAVNSGSVTVSYMPQVVSVRDYYSFGSEIEERSYMLDDYRFAFNGKEKDNEVKGTGNSLDFGARIYGSRLGRWLSVDPLYSKYPNLSPYNFVANNPIRYIDPDGSEIVDPNGKKVTITFKEDGSLGFSNNATPDIIRVANALNMTEMGRLQLKIVDQSDIKVKIKISTETKITITNKDGAKIKSYKLGETVQGNRDKSKNFGKYVDKNGKYGITEASITIYEGTIKEVIKKENNNLYTGLTVEEVIGGVAAHEIVHATDKEEIHKDIKHETEIGRSRSKKETEAKPRKIEMKVISEIKMKKN